MATLKMPNEIEPLKHISVLIYGQPGIGKTTLACSAADAVLFDYDGGVNRINPAHMIPTLQVESWEDTSEALDLIKSNPAFSATKTIVIDTVGKMLDYMTESIFRTNPKMKQYDGTLSLKGYGVRKKMFQDFTNLLTVSGYNVVYIAHEKEDKDGDSTIKRPLVGGSSAADLIQGLYLVGYMQAHGNQRTISFNPTDSFYAKNSCNIPDSEVPVVVSKDGLNAKPITFMEDVVFGGFRKAQQNQKDMRMRYADVLARIDDAIQEVTDAESLNAAVDVIKKLDVIYDSKVRALQAISAKASALGLSLNKQTKRYE